MNWLRVKQSDKCSVCGHSSWCVYNEHVVLCMRVQSTKPITLKSGEVGWLHSIGDHPRPVRCDPAPEPPTINARKIIEDWLAKSTRSVSSLSDKIGVRASALMDLQTAWAPEHRAWAWPMQDGYGNIVGIRLRSDSGAKWAVPGSHAGIFIPKTQTQSTVLVTEGPTDTAAALSMGYYAIGRPSCSGGMQHIANHVRRMAINRVVLVADADDPGVNGAQMMANHCQVPCCVIIPPAKDLREFYNLGGTQTLLECIIGQAIWKVK